MCVRYILLLVSIALFLPLTASAIDVFFVPDTSSGQIGETVLLSCQIGPTDLMRSFTIYMSYDTNRIDLFEPPTAGPVIAGHSGLQFNYFDHAPFLPDVLEVTATVFGTDFWQGPGEIFQMRFILRACGDEPIVAPYQPFFVAANDTYPPGMFFPALVQICQAAPPQAPTHLVIYPTGGTAVTLTWNAVTQDTSGNPLPSAPVYDVIRQQIQPSLLPPSTIATVPNPPYVDSYSAGVEYIYNVIARTIP